MATTIAPTPTSPAQPKHPYFVPEVRVLKLADWPRGADEGEVIEGLAADVVRAEVTRVNTGAGQYAITLNNWFDTLPGDRKTDTSVSRGEVIVGQRPLFPRFKYNDFERLQFGKRLRIDMRYWPPDPAAGAGQAW